MARKIIYLINPVSGTRGKSSIQDLISRRTREQQIDFSILPTNAEGNYAHLIPLIKETQVTDIVVCGGDGTVNAVAAALRGVDVRIGIIPMGSGNGLAFAARIPRDPSKALDLVFAGMAAPIDAFMINERFSCMLSGIGFDARVAHEFARQKKRGLQTYMRVTLLHFFSSRPHSFTIRLPRGGEGGRDPARGGRGGDERSGGTGDSGQGGQSGTRDRGPGDRGKGDRGKGERSFAVEAFFISIANANQFGNQFTIAPKASLHDGLLDIVIAKKTDKISLLFSVLRQVLGGYSLQTDPAASHTRGILYFQTDSLVIVNEEEAPLHIDGDPAPTAKEFVIRVIREALMLIRP
jgi:diacylglycerol kinase (ATP)